MNARAATRAALKEVPPHQPSKRAVLDSRQKALKLTANALYGFTGAGASPLQCAPLADSCLAMGCQVDTGCPTHCFRSAASCFSTCRCLLCKKCALVRTGLSDEDAQVSTFVYHERDLRVLAQSCRRAIDMLNSAFAEGQFGASARDARVIYGQTDSLFVAFPSSTVSACFNLGHLLLCWRLSSGLSSHCGALSGKAWR